MYQDIAIGAPFEDDNRGAIYIFNKAEDTFTQHIKAEQLDSGLRAFGFQISAPFDIDKNTYNGSKV